MELEEILERMKNHSTSSCVSGETPESSRDSDDVCPICHGSEWILVKKNGVEAAKPCKCRERAVMSRRLRFADIPEAFRGMDLKTFRMDVYFLSGPEPKGAEKPGSPQESRMSL